jgi:hypothetical protein
MVEQIEFGILPTFQDAEVILNTAGESISSGSHFDAMTGVITIEPLPDFENLRRTHAIIDAVIALPKEWEGAMDSALLEIKYPDTDLLQIIVLKIAIDDVILYQGRLKSAEEDSSSTSEVLKDWSYAIETVTGAKRSADSADLELAEGRSEKNLDVFFQLYAHELSSLSAEGARWLSELHESSHGKLDRSHLQAVRQVLDISLHVQFGDLIKHNIGMSRWMDYVRMLNELSILDEAIATFHSLRGQEVIVDDHKGDLTEDTALFSLSLLAVHVAYGYIPTAIVEYDVQEPLSPLEDPVLFVSVVNPISNLSRSSTFLFQGDLEPDKTPPEPHVAAALLLLAGENSLRTDIRGPLLADREGIDVADRVRHFIDYPEDVPKFLNLSFYTRLLKAYANRIEGVKEIAEQIIEVFAAKYAAGGDS